MAAAATSTIHCNSWKVADKLSQHIDKLKFDFLEMQTAALFGRYSWFCFFPKRFLNIFNVKSIWGTQFAQGQSDIHQWLHVD